MSNIEPALIDALRSSRHIVALTGAGISAESGIPTFRGAQGGFWAKYRPEDLATPEGFQRNPKLVWEWYAWRREQVGKVAPNAGHHALVEMERRAPRFTLITQNVDGLHQHAGSRSVIELHGNIGRVKCFDDGKLVTQWQDDSVPPRCPRCGGMLRPDVVWFGEMLPDEAIARACDAAEAADLFFSIGTSTLVHPAAALPFQALRNGARIVEVNPESTPLTERAQFILRGKSGELLPKLIAAAWQ